MDCYNDVEVYLMNGQYPSGMGKGEKSNFRRKCKNNFKIEDGILYYRRHHVEGTAEGLGDLW